MLDLAPQGRDDGYAKLAYTEVRRPLHAGRGEGLGSAVMGVRWQISEHVEHDVVILRLAGRGVFLCEGDGALWVRIKGLVTDGYVRILLNVQSVDYIDSFSLGEIVQGFKAAQLAGGRLGVCHLVPKVRGVFAATKLNDVIPLFDTEAEGIRALKT